MNCLADILLYRQLLNGFAYFVPTTISIFQYNAYFVMMYYIFVLYPLGNFFHLKIPFKYYNIWSRLIMILAKYMTLVSMFYVMNELFSVLALTLCLDIADTQSLNLVYNKKITMKRYLYTSIQVICFAFMYLLSCPETILIFLFINYCYDIIRDILWLCFGHFFTNVIYFAKSSTLLFVIIQYIYLLMTTKIYYNILTIPSLKNYH